MGNMDASTVSADHATSIEPFLADQIEVLKGPATLLFGSGAIGGAVNVVDGRIARELPERPLSGRAELRGNSRQRRAACGRPGAQWRRLPHPGLRGDRQPGRSPRPRPRS
ncbi:hypothetical protein G6F24_016624 [Rhizopus arrhizus]|nr:hypothetical protein G6F24_016624 [Rhizopus arrhizus]